MMQATGIDGLINSMEDLDPAREEAPSFGNLVKALSESVKALERRSNEFPTGQDFHFYANFQEFKRPVAIVQSRVASLLSQLGSLKDVIPHPIPFPADVDEGYDWLVGVQDAFLERVDASLDKFYLERKAETKQKLELNAFEVASAQSLSRKSPLSAGSASEGSKSGDVKVARNKDKSTMRSPIPFHIPSIPRPQDRFDEAVDNSNTPFRHKAPKIRTQMESAEGSTRIGSGDMCSVSTLSVLEEHARKLGHKDPADNTHPMEDELTEMAYVVGLLDIVQIRKYRSLDETPFTFVSTTKALKEMAIKLRKAGEIAIDLENHHYRSYQGFVCLMQVSTRDEDFIVDTLDLRSQIGPYLGDIFADAAIKKVMHGADRDIVWLQRDFGIYVCNLFDTGQAARVLQLQGFGLAFLLEHFCKVQADKRYQLADWRIRPLPAEMIKYAREDTHYLLYVHDMLKQLLLDARANKKAEEDDPVTQVYKRSRDLCLQLYAKEIFTETSYQHLYGLQEKKFGPEQLAVLSALYSWRDTIARKEDESTGFVLPNHLLLQLAAEMPGDARQLQSYVKGSHSFVSRHASAVIEIIRQSREKALRELEVLHLESEDGELTGESPREDIVSEQMNSEVSKVTQSLRIDETVEKVDEEKRVEGRRSWKTLQTEKLVAPTETKTDESLASETTGSDEAGHSFTQTRSGDGLSKVDQAMPDACTDGRNRSIVHEEQGQGQAQERIVCESLTAKVAVTSRETQVVGSVFLATVEAVDRVGDEHFTVSETSQLQVLDTEEKTPQIEVNAISGETSSIPAPVVIEAVSENSSTLQATRKPSKLGALLGGRKRGPQRRPWESAKDMEQARMKTEEIECSMVLPFGHRVQSLADLPGTNEPAPFTGEDNAITVPEENLHDSDLILSEVNPPRSQEETAENMHDSNLILSEVNPPLSLEETADRPATSTTPELPDVLMFESEVHEDLKDLRRRRTWWPPAGTESGNQRTRDSTSPRTARDQAFDQCHGDKYPDMPMSLSEMHRNSRRGKKKSRSHSEACSIRGNPVVPSRDLGSPGSGSTSKKRRKEQSLVTEDNKHVKRMANTENRLDLKSFNYREARDALGLNNLFVTVKGDDRQGTESHAKGRGSWKDTSTHRIPLSKTAFDPLRRTREEPRPEGIKPGQRRQVFPQSGNRTAVFKQ